MLKEIILKQKEEKEEFLSRHYVKRTKESFGKKWINTDLIKVILGPRRSGKSVFCLMLLKNRPFMYFNFDDEILSSKDGLKTYELMEELHGVYGKTKNILFDEIQNLPRWELFVNRLHREGYNIVLTGSNANLLSQELATALTGRHIPIEILPFDFNEFLRAKDFQIDIKSNKKHDKLLILLNEYLVNGGFPEIVINNFDPKNYLGALFDSLLFKDVVKRHKVKFSTNIDNLGSYLINSFSSLYTLRKLQNILGLKSITTTEKYTRYLEEAYIIFSLLRYSHKAGERLKSPKKVYVIDNGFISAKAVQHSPDTGKLLENLVFIELVKKGFEPNRNLFYYKTRNDREVDFVLKKERTITELVQVVYKLDNPETEQREIKALIEASQELKVQKLTIITWDEKKKVEKDGLIINIIPVWERFLG